MFPVSFADAVVAEFSKPGDVVLDPFAGRGTAVFSAASTNRIGIGIEIHPVGWIYAKTKLATPPKITVVDRLREIARCASQKRFGNAAANLPEFFHYAYSPGIRRFLVAARALLNWRRVNVDRALMALLLVYLHGKYTQALSNQMRQTKAMSPQYAVRWWQEHNFEAPDLDSVEFMLPRIAWRYAKGVPAIHPSSTVYLGNAVYQLARVQQRIQERTLPRVRLVFTSPPYFGVTNYHYDQWLRNWLLGGPPNALRIDRGPHGRKFENRDAYRQLLQRVFSGCRAVLARKGTIYVRTDAREFTLETTHKVLLSEFPSASIEQIDARCPRPTQTALFGDHAPKPGEVDLIVQR